MRRNVGGNADVICDKDDHRVRIRVFHVSFNGGKFRRAVRARAHKALSKPRTKKTLKTAP